MLDCIKFILEYTAKFCAMLFSINIGSGMSLGLLLSILFIFLPVVYRVLTYLKHDVIGELDEMYDESRPRVTTSNTLYEKTNLGNGRYTIYRNGITYKRRYRK